MQSTLYRDVVLARGSGVDQIGRYEKGVGSLTLHGIIFPALPPTTIAGDFGIEAPAPRARRFVSQIDTSVS